MYVSRMVGLTPGVGASMLRVLRIHKALKCQDPKALFLEVLYDGRFVDALIRIVYECPDVMHYFHKSWAVFLDILYRRIDIFDGVMDRIVESLEDTVKVDIRPESVTDARVGRLLIHLMDRYPGKFVFLIGAKACFDDINVVDAVLHVKKKLIGPW
jgi:hypothetical protein